MLAWRARPAASAQPGAAPSREMPDHPQSVEACAAPASPRAPNPIPYPRAARGGGLPGRRGDAARAAAAGGRAGARRHRARRRPAGAPPRTDTAMRRRCCSHRRCCESGPGRCARLWRRRSGRAQPSQACLLPRGTAALQAPRSALPAATLPEWRVCTPQCCHQGDLIVSGHVRPCARSRRPPWTACAPRAGAPARRAPARRRRPRPRTRAASTRARSSWRRRCRLRVEFMAKLHPIALAVALPAGTGMPCMQGAASFRFP
jgi:hypothetical protein